MDINALVAQYQTVDELKIFISSQYKQILQLTKKNKELEDKITESKKQIKDQLKQDITLTQTSNLPVIGDMKVLDDAKTIAQIQLHMLKEIAFDKELTLEEAKRVDIFNRILNDQLKAEKPSLKADAKVVKSEELLRLVQDVST